MTRVIRILAGGLAAGITALLLIASIRLLVADILSRSDSVEARESAVRLFPGSVPFILSEVDLLRQQDDDVRQELTDATRAEPANARLYIQLGLECERAGDFRAATAELTEATRLSHEFLPRWTLANYYFRRGNVEQFLYWSREALTIGTDDLRPVFNLLWRSGIPAAEVRTAIPETEKVALAYVPWLMDHGKVDEAAPAAAFLLARYPNAAASVLIAYCARLSNGDAKQEQQAATLWNALCARHLLTQSPVYPARPPAIVDSSFQDNSDDLAFGWRAAPSVRSYHTSRGFVIDLDGNQPEELELLKQLVPVIPGRGYAIRSDYLSNGIPAGSGIWWRVEDPQTHASFSGAPQFLSDDGTSVTVPFNVPADCRFVFVVLEYARQPGTVRVSGTLQLRNVRLSG